MTINTYYNPKSITSIINKAAKAAVEQFNINIREHIIIKSTRRRYIAQWWQIMDGLHYDQIILIIRDLSLPADNIVAVSILTIDKECCS